jgi:hypothetical protein
MLSLTPEKVSKFLAISPTSPFKVGGTDLGYPVFNKKDNSLSFLFGDTFALQDFLDKKNFPYLEWRSNSLGIMDKFSLKKPLEINRFYSSSSSVKASSVLEGLHIDKLEMSKIPTGGVYLHDNLYFGYFSIASWSYSSKKKMNYGGIAKLGSDNKVHVIEDLTFINKDAEDLTLVKSLFHDYSPSFDFESHLINNLTEVYLKDFGDDYLYIFGQGAYRDSPLYLFRNKKDSFESLSTFEVYIGNGKFEKLSKKNKGEPICKDSLGEFSLIYLKKHQQYLLMATDYINNSLVYYVSDSLYGPFKGPYSLIKLDDPLLKGFKLYAPLSDECLVNENEDELTLIMSQWLPAYQPLIMKVKIGEEQ